jgi:hypothetical protein
VSVEAGGTYNYRAAAKDITFSDVGQYAGWRGGTCSVWVDASKYVRSRNERGKAECLRFVIAGT